MPEPEQAENSQQTENANHQQGLCAGDKKTNVGGKHCQQVDNAEKTGRIFHRAAQAIQTHQVLDSKENGVNPFQDVKKIAEHPGHFFDALQHDYQHTADDGNHQSYIEPFAVNCAGVEDYFVKFVLAAKDIFIVFIEVFVPDPAQLKKYPGKCLTYLFMKKRKRFFVESQDVYMPDAFQQFNKQLL
jgi:hypothetical protein